MFYLHIIHIIAFTFNETALNMSYNYLTFITAWCGNFQIVMIIIYATIILTWMLQKWDKNATKQW